MTQQSNQASRACNLHDLELILNKLFSEESFQRGLAFKPRPSDVLISPYAKCGTTWLQHIVHGLRTRGNLDFEEITSVTPWIEIANTMDWDLEAPQLANPRVYKSHLSWHKIPKGGRYICCFRNPADAFISFYHFFEGFFFEPGSLSLEEVFYWRWPRDSLADQGYWYHLSSWWEQRNNKDVLLLCYEDMKADLAGTIKSLAQFINIDLDDELFQIVLKQSSREFMLSHKEKFGELPLRQRAYTLGILPFEVDAHKVTPGAATKPQLSPDLQKELDEIWQEHINAKFGLENYKALRQELKNLTTLKTS